MRHAGDNPLRTTLPVKDRIRFKTEWETMMARIQSKPLGWDHLFEVPGYRWEDQTQDLKALHIETKEYYLVVYAYARATEFNCVKFYPNQYTAKDDEQWLGPMEAMCLALEALKLASTQPSSNNDT